MDIIKLENEWHIVARIGGGGFGEVFRVTSGTQECALKLVPKCPGAERELLFVDLGNSAVNVVPVLECGETDDYWVMVMPLAECSHRDRIDSTERPSFEESIGILLNVAASLASIADHVVHRDLKPENILLLDGKWCLADFGISRYAEATTAAETQKYALTPAYTAPERWRCDRATNASDVYSFGVVAYELLTGRLPFDGPRTEDFREQHLEVLAPRVGGVPASIAALVGECLYKAPEARPTAADVITRIEKARSSHGSAGRSRLAAANLAVVQSQAEVAREQSQRMSEEEHRGTLLQSAKRSYEEIGGSLLDVIRQEAPAASVTSNCGQGWSVGLNSARLTLSDVNATDTNPWNWEAPAFDVIAHASLSLTIPKDRHGYRGRDHSLWFCDAGQPDEYAWYETAFMISALIPRMEEMAPFSLPPGEESAKALWRGQAEFQVAWPFARLQPGDIKEFIGRWTEWLADAATGRLRYPSRLPERRPEGSWR